MPEARRTDESERTSPAGSVNRRDVDDVVAHGRIEGERDVVDTVDPCCHFGPWTKCTS